MLRGPLALLPLLLLSPLVVSAQEIQLMLVRGPAEGEVTLHWTGGSAPWEIYRSSTAVSLTEPMNLLGDTLKSPWIDLPPATALTFYSVESCGIPMETQTSGCPTCFCCRPWSISWEPVQCTSYYRVSWQCFTAPEMAVNVVGATSIEDLCAFGMCDDAACANAINYISVQACSGTGCSNAVDVPSIPLVCGGGCCC